VIFACETPGAENVIAKSDDRPAADGVSRWITAATGGPLTGPLPRDWVDRFDLYRLYHAKELIY
jgi:hypothetical protein